MNLPLPSAPLLTAVGFVLLVAALRSRRMRGLSRGSTEALDNETLFSKRHHATGVARPDLDFASFGPNVAALELLVRNHYWYRRY